MSLEYSQGSRHATSLSEKTHQWDFEPLSSRGEAGQPNLVEWAAAPRALNIALNVRLATPDPSPPITGSPAIDAGQARFHYEWVGSGYTAVVSGPLLRLTRQP